MWPTSFDSLVEEATRVLDAATPFSARGLCRTFTVCTTDHVHLILGPVVDRILRDEAPEVTLRFLPSMVVDWIPLRDGAADLSVCILRAGPATSIRSCRSGDNGGESARSCPASWRGSTWSPRRTAS